MSLSNFKVFNDFTQGTATELLQENVNLFNEATRGGITLTAKGNSGDFYDESKWKKINNLVRTRNAYGSGALTSQPLSQISETSVKIGAGTIPVEVDPGDLAWIQKSPAEAGVVFGRQLAQGQLENMVSNAIGAAAVALAAQTTNYYDGKAGNGSLTALNSGKAKLGDKSSSIVCWLLNSKVAHDIYSTALTNSERLFTFGNVEVMSDGFGKPLVITDVDTLVKTDGINSGTDSYYTIGLVAGGVNVEDNGDYYQLLDESNGKENIEATIQAQWSYNLGIRGFAYDKANGGKSPNEAALLTATNWDKVATSHKDLAGVVIETA